MTNQEPWFSAKCLFLHKGLSRRQRKPCYEERITLIRAQNFKQALRKGEAEAKRYAKSLEGTEYLGFIRVYHLFESRIGDGAEIYSDMRSVSTAKKAFIRRFYDNGSFHERDASELDR